MNIEKIELLEDKPHETESEIQPSESQDNPIAESDESESELSTGEVETETSGNEDEESGEAESESNTTQSDTSVDETVVGSSDIYDGESVSGNGGKLGFESEIVTEEITYYSEEFQAQVIHQFEQQRIHTICGTFMLAIIAGPLLGKLILERLK